MNIEWVEAELVRFHSFGYLLLLSTSIGVSKGCIVLHPNHGSGTPVAGTLSFSLSLSLTRGIQSHPAGLSLSLSSWPPASTALSLSPTPPPFGVRPRNGIKLGETRGNGEGRRKREEVAERERMRGWASPDRHYCCLEQKGCASFFDWMR